MKEIFTSYETLVNLFERTQIFLQRLNQYTTAPLTGEMTELLAKILAQVLSVLAFSTKAMKETRTSVFIRSKYSFLVDHGTEMFMKRLVGKTDVENALQRLDMLTKEECLMTAARTLGVTRHIDDNVMGIEKVIHDIRDDMNMIKEITFNPNDGLKCGASHSFGFFIYALIFSCYML